MAHSHANPVSSGRKALAALRLVIGLLLIWVGLANILHLNSLGLSVDPGRLVSEPVAPMARLCMPWLAVICGTCLVCGSVYLALLVAALSLVLLVTVTLASGWRGRMQFGCGSVDPGPHCVGSALARDIH